MNNLVTLISDPDKFALNETELGSVVDAIQSSGGIIEDVNWLADGEACDIFFAVLPQDEALEILTHLLANVPLDFVVQNPVNRRKKLLICDMDSTIIEQECIDEIAAFAEVKDKVSSITERAMKGELAFEDALRERVGLLSGLALDDLEKVYNNKITLTKGAKELVLTMKDNGARTVIATGGFSFFSEKVKAAAGFDFEEANILEVEDNKLTGKVREPILGREAKFNTLKYHVEDAGLALDNVVAVGDGANDLSMLQCAMHGGGLGIAYHANENIKQQVKHKIDYCDLRAILYTQGYKADEITVV